MCSINGFTWADKELITRMNTATAHRGPDGTGVFVAPEISLGHNRLAIIDLSPAGAQPMKSADERLTIVFNGEIYNFRELKKELAPYPWRSESDTEVILAAYERWGEKAFARLDGIFAFALYDRGNNRLLLVRDPQGVKPLYYAEKSGKLLFASEIKALLEWKEMPRRISREALDIYMRILYVPAPLTMFEGIQKLLPGHFLSYRNGSTTLLPYDIRKDAPISYAPFEEQKKELYRLVGESVKAQLVSDRPVGLYLSGGVDSTAVLEAMTRASGSVESFSVGFELQCHEEPHKFNADFLLARKTARHFGATHNEVLLSPHEIIPLFEEAMYHLDEPIANATIIPMLKLARFAKQKVAVVFGGDGGDELFGGYERYRWSLISSHYRKVPAFLRHVVQGLTPNLKRLDAKEGIERFVRFHFQKENILRPLLALSAYRTGVSEAFFTERFFEMIEQPFEAQFMRVDRESWLIDESLLRSDKMSMAGGIEARVPLLAPALIRFADSVPLQHKVSLTRTKILLKEAFRGHLPDELLEQPKRGWFSPAAKWLRYPEVAAYAKEALSPDYTEATRELFDWQEVRRRLTAHLAGEYHLNPLWAILTLQVWARTFKVKSS